MDDEQIEARAMEEAFNATRNAEEPTSSPAPTAPAEEDLKSVAGDSSADASQEQQPDSNSKEAQTPSPQGDDGKAKQQDAPEPVLFAGFTETQLKDLLGKASRFDELEGQLRKAHGKIGELNGEVIRMRDSGGKSQQQQDAGRPPATPDVNLDDDPELAQVAEEWPEMARLAKAYATKILGQAGQQGVSQDGLAALQSNLTAEITRNMHVEFMELQHRGWKDTVTGQEFKTWLAAQPEPVRTTYQTTESAFDLSPILTDFKSFQEKAKRQVNRQRLDESVVPEGGRRPPQQEDLDDENAAMQAGFDSVMRRQHA